MNTKKIPMLLMLLVLTAFMTNSCTGGKSPSAEEEAETDSLAADSLAQDTVVDLVAEVPQSKAVDELFERLGREELAFGAVLVHELFGTGVGAVEHGDLVAVVCEIACEAAAHCGQADDADVCFS